MITPRRIFLVSLVSLLSFCSVACLRQARARRNRAEADRAEAQADLARAEAQSIRSGQAAPEGEYVEADSAPQPPAAVQEAMPPAPSTVHVWIAGCHEWQHGGWVWMPGRWVARPRAGVMWAASHWARRGHGWVWVGGVWR
jgi:hypothetical protein